MSHQKVLELKRKLKKSWNIFFSRFGKLLPVQLETIPLVLEGKNLIISSSTASGKTEAVIAPLVERFLNENWENLAVLYITPTRALVNDIEYRLKDQLIELNISLNVKTGDRPQFNPRKPSNFLITTPESFDSLLCRNSKVFQDLRAVIIDEVHLIDKTYRGDQLLLLLKRLKHFTDFNIFALSATIADCKDVGSRYLQNFDIVKIPDKRKIEYTLINLLEEILNYVRKEDLKKILIFCNKRKSVEAIALYCQNLKTPFTIIAHHGSLSRSVREEAEKFMKESKYWICVATMTLEIGIDIGDIDAIVLAEIPWSISSLLQRIGRGNRRTNKNRAFGLYDNEKRKIILERMFSIANKGDLESKPYSADLSVVVQQIFSSLFANPEGLIEDYFLKIFENFCSKENLSDILNHLENKLWILKKSKKWYATKKLMDLGEKGVIHSNIPDEKSMTVIDINSSRFIGNILYPVDNVFVLGGKVWKITKIETYKIYVKKVKSNAYLPNFKIHDPIGKFYFYLPGNLRKKKLNFLDFGS